MQELSNGCKEIVTVDTTTGKVSIMNPEEPDNAPKEWTFDAAYGK